jgi:hypothetical protein
MPRIIVPCPRACWISCIAACVYWLIFFVYALHLVLISKYPQNSLNVLIMF